MKSKTIVLWVLDDLLSSSVELFLTAQKDWNVINISGEEHLDSVFQTVDKVKPDVVILHKEKQTGRLDLPHVLLQNHPNLKVIVVSLKNNLMEVYSKQNILVKSTADLIFAVEADMQGQVG